MMDILLGLINAAACGLIALVLCWLVLDPKVHDGIVIKTGLIAMVLGFGSISLLLFDGLEPAEVIGLERSLLLVNAGIATVIAGYLLRKASARHALRRSTDWSDLDTMPAERWAQVSGGKR
jgi:sulfite exporter TauE/SafE